MASPAAMVTSKTSSTVAVYSGEHLFRVVGHSQMTGANALVTSETFGVGGHDWAILYYPNGDTRVVDGQFASVFLELRSACESEVTASYSFCLHDPATPGGTGDKNKFSCVSIFSPSMPEKAWGNIRFVSKADVAASGCLKDDCLVIKCTVEFSKLVSDAEDDFGSIIVPPSDLSKDLHSMLGSGLKEDLTVNVGGSRSFKAHACVLSARSPEFRAQLCDSTTGSKQSSICIEDMDPVVFEALLHYMYNDSLPASMEETTEEAAKMARQLLVVADRYKLERLKLLCESKLSKVIDVSRVGFTLDLAEEYSCQQLKDCCLKYMATDCDRLQAIKGTEGFEQLKKKRPLVVCDILDEFIARRNRLRPGEGK